VRVALLEQLELAEVPAQAVRTALVSREGPGDVGRLVAVSWDEVRSYLQ
jgi:hypothetical protein